MHRDGLSIGEVARSAEVRASAIRFYESAGLLPPPQREGGQRRYDADVLLRLQVIVLAQHAGLTITDIRTLLSEFGDEATTAERWGTLATEKLPQIEAEIARAEAMKRVLEKVRASPCRMLESCAQLARDLLAA